MPDRESAITHLQIISTWASFARGRDLQFFTAKHLEDISQWANDAIALLKEQEKENSRIANEYLNLVKVASKQPKIVRCKYCSYGEPVKNGAGDDCIQCSNDELWLDGNVNFPDWFCADGERR